MIRYFKGRSDFPKSLFISGLIIFLLIFWLFKVLHNQPEGWTPLMICRNNLKQLGLGMQIYASENSGSYPTSEKWCDLITPSLGDSADKIFYCPTIKDNQCYYAMNPNCKPDSPLDTVLLFETKKGGWNLTGGSELATTENHKEKVCNVLFNDGTVKRIKKDEIANLKWQ